MKLDAPTHKLPLSCAIWIYVCVSSVLLTSPLHIVKPVCWQGGRIIARTNHGYTRHVCPSDFFCHQPLWWQAQTHVIIVTSWWARWRLKSPASPMFTQPFIQAHIKENIKALRHWPLWGNSPVTGEFSHKGPVTRKMFPFDDVIMYQDCTKWATFCKRYFQMQFLVWKLLYFDTNFAEVCSRGFIWNTFALVQDMVWHKTITRTNVNPDLERRMVSLSRNELIALGVCRKKLRLFGKESWWCQCNSFVTKGNI